jgi:hypothetical protein
VGGCSNDVGQRSAKWVNGSVELLDVSGRYSQVNAISADGSTLVGSMDTEGYVYATSVRERLPFSLNDVSHDGLTAVGAAFREQGNWDTAYALHGLGGGSAEAPLSHRARPCHDRLRTQRRRVSQHHHLERDSHHEPGEPPAAAPPAAAAPAERQTPRASPRRVR